MDDLSGTLVKGYTLKERLDVGGYGAVYRAEQGTVGREVAIKVILPEYANQPEFIRSFEIEAQVIARLEHPHIVPLYDYWRDPEGAYLVMRWLRGGSLLPQVAQGPLPLATVTKVLEQIGSALLAAHRQGVIHGDLKPGNVLLDTDGNTYLADFGIAREVVNISLIEAPTSTVLIGSPPYLSPEQIEHQDLSPQTDIYSFGVMLYQLLTGELPFKTNTPIGFYFHHLHNPIPDVCALRPDLPAGLNAVIQRATAKRPADRYPDVQRLIDDFTRAIARGTDAVPSNGHSRGNGHSAGGNGLVRELYASAAVAPSEQDVVPAANPYKGLHAFQESDAANFFGRESLTRLLLEHVTRPGSLGQFLAVIGPSGSGKSSVVRAGLIPALRNNLGAGSQHWFIATFRPGPQPLDELASALLRVAVVRPNALLEQLQADQYGLLRVIKQMLPADPQTELLLIIDQFEEVFTLVKDETSRTHFLNSLMAAVTAPGSRLRILVTLRADFYDRPLLYPGFSDLVRQRTEVVLPLTTVELQDAISRPLARAGVTAEPALVEALLHDVGEQPGTLPLLQYVLTELFEQREGQHLTLAAYQASGGVLGALAKRADTIYEQLEPTAPDATRQLFLRLVTLGEGTEDTRRRVPRPEVSSLIGTGPVLDRVIEAFTSARLLTIDSDPLTHIPTIEVAHEALIRTWSRLRQWLDTSRDDLRVQQRLAQMTADWLGAGKDAGYLAAGGRLQQLEAWSATTYLALNRDEQSYLDASLAARDEMLRQEATRSARETRLRRSARLLLWMLVGLMLLATLGALQLSSQARRGQVAAEGSAREARNLALAAGAQAALSEGNTDLALSLAMVANQLDPVLPQEEYALAQAAYAPGTSRLLAGHTNRVRGVAVSTDGRVSVSGGEDGQVILWDLRTGKALRTLKDSGAQVTGVALSPQADTAAAATENNVLVWDLNTGALLKTLSGHSASVLAVAYSPDGTQLLSGSDDTTVILWDLASGRPSTTLRGHSGAVQAVAFSPEGTSAVSGAVDKTIIVWDLQTGKPQLDPLVGHTDTVTTVAWSPDSRSILSGSKDKNILKWDVESGQVISVFFGHSRDVTSVVWSQDGATVLSGSRDGSVGLWNADGTLRGFISGGGGTVTSVAFGGDGHTLLLGSDDFQVRLLDTRNGAEVQTLSGHTDRVTFAVFSPDGRTVLSGSGDSSMKLWDVSTGEVLGTFTGHKKAIGAVAFSPDGKLAVSASTDTSLIIWDVATQRQLRTLQGHAAEVSAVAWSPDGTKILSGGGDKQLVLWDAATGQQLQAFTGHTQKIYSVVFSPDGQTALSGAGDTTIIRWDVATGKQLQTYSGHSAQVRSVAVSRDGKYALSAGSDKQVIYWDIATGRQIRSMVGHKGDVWSVSFSPDGTRAVSSSDDATLVVWDLASGEPLRRYKGHAGPVRTVAFAPDGKLIVSGSTDQTMRLWKVDALPELMEWTRTQRYVPSLTCDQIEKYQLAAFQLSCAAAAPSAPPQ